LTSRKTDKFYADNVTLLSDLLEVARILKRALAGKLYACFEYIMIESRMI